MFSQTLEWWVEPNSCGVEIVVDAGVCSSRYHPDGYAPDPSPLCVSGDCHSLMGAGRFSPGGGAGSCVAQDF